MRLDHVFDPDETGVGFVAVVDDALSDVLVDMGAVVVGGYGGGARVGGIGMEGVEMGA